jgi:S-adenosyl methyltransferase
MYDYFLGGTNNFEVDRQLGDRLKALVPEIGDSAWANRSFHQRAARWMADHGLRQFIDIGAGLPTQGNTHDLVQQVAP